MRAGGTIERTTLSALAGVKGANTSLTGIRSDYVAFGECSAILPPASDKDVLRLVVILPRPVQDAGK